MNAIFFGLKRAYHGTLHISRRLLRRLGLTAARFDMMFAIENGFLKSRLQSDLRRILGVTAPTVSRMLGSLEELGYVTRSRPPRDARQRDVRLTPLGEKRIRRARQVTMQSGLAQLAVDSALTDEWYDDDATFLAMSNFESVLNRVRHAFRDTARVHYPWHPED